MKKRFKRMLDMALLGAMILSGGATALAAAETEAVTETDVEVGGPLPTVEGIDFRNVYVDPVPDSGAYTITILGAKSRASSGKDLVYGIAAFNRSTNMAEDIPQQGWEKPDPQGRVTFRNVTAEDIIITSADRDSSQKTTPADRFNKEKTGIKFVLPAMNVYNAMQPVDPSQVEKGSASVTIRSTSKDRDYALFNSKKGELAGTWQSGTGADLNIPVDRALIGVVVAVTRISKPKEPVIIPDTPHVLPGGDVALTKVGFSPRTAMAVLTIQATPGLAYALTQANGDILDISQRVKWGITAETEDEFNVMADSTNFYAAPAQGDQIRFRVPAGGTYNVVTRFPDGSTSRPNDPYQVDSVKGNENILGPYEDPETGQKFARIVINPASQYSRYAAKNTETGQITKYYSPVDGIVRFDAYMPIDSIVVVAQPIPLTGTDENTPSPGQSSPTQETMPPVLKKTVSGNGETQDGRRLTAGAWDASNSPFASGQAAVEDALNSGVCQLLDPLDFSGAALASVAVEPVTMIVLHDWNGKPSYALYFYDDEWFQTSLVDLEDGTYMVNFRDGIVGYIDFTESAG